jgi:hypothetical protein
MLRILTEHCLEPSPGGDLPLVDAINHSKSRKDDYAPSALEPLATIVEADHHRECILRVGLDGRV